VSTLPEAEIPDFALTDSATAKLVKTLDVEWKSPRQQLNLYITTAINPSLEDWLQVGSVSMINPYGYPFRVILITSSVLSKHLKKVCMYYLFCNKN